MVTSTSRLHLPRFANPDRPALDRIQATSVIPVNTLGEELAAELKASFHVDSNDDYRCATVGRLWESLLDRYPDEPFLMLRVADMRLALGSTVTALALYEKLQSKLDDPAFGVWVAKFRTATYTELRDRLRQYIRDSILFTPSQRWRSGVCNSPFPYCKLQHHQLASLRSSWNDLGTDRELVMSRYINYHAIETNALEGVVYFDDITTARLVKDGFFNQASLVHEGNIMDGAVRDVPEALSTLRDTREALETVIEAIQAEDFQLTVDFVCRLHKTLMNNSRVLRIRARGEGRLTYFNIGVTRQQTYVNVTVSSVLVQGGTPIVIQFCPYYDVDAELTTFCARFNELMRVPSMGPIAAAAWISYVFITIHPFEDGNGRLSRILASIPLLKQGLPPLCVPADLKSTYLGGLNALRANGDGDYSRHMSDLYSTTMSSVSAMAKLIHSRC